MFKNRENPDKLKAGALAVLVHLLLLGGLLISFSWKAAHPVLNVAEVELWDKMPTPTAKPHVEPKLEPAVEEPKEEPKPEPKPVVKEEPKPEEPKVDIELENKKKQEAEKKAKEIEKTKQLEEKRKQAADRQKALDALRDEDLAPTKPNKKNDDDAIKKLKESMLGDESAAQAKAASSANAGEINEYKARIQAKIRGNIIKSLCAEGYPRLRFGITLLPTGELNGAPKILKSSGNQACDEAVERAIMAAQPLPLPDDKSLFADNFRNLTLNIEPNKAE